MELILEGRAVKTGRKKTKDVPVSGQDLRRAGDTQVEGRTTLGEGLPLFKESGGIVLLVIIDELGAILTEPDPIPRGRPLGRGHGRVVPWATGGSSSDVRRDPNVNTFGRVFPRPRRGLLAVWI